MKLWISSFFTASVVMIFRSASCAPPRGRDTHARTPGRPVRAAGGHAAPPGLAHPSPGPAQSPWLAAPGRPCERAHFTEGKTEARGDPAQGRGWA